MTNELIKVIYEEVKDINFQDPAAQEIYEEVIAIFDKHLPKEKEEQERHDNPCYHMTNRGTCSFQKYRQPENKWIEKLSCIWEDSIETYEKINVIINRLNSIR